MKRSVKIQLLLLGVQILLIATFIFVGCNISDNIEPISEPVDVSQRKPRAYAVSTASARLTMLVPAYPSISDIFWLQSATGVSTISAIPISTGALPVSISLTMKSTTRKSGPTRRQFRAYTL